MWISRLGIRLITVLDILIFNDCNSGISGDCHSRNSRIFQEKVPEISKNVNTINSIMSINGGLQLLHF